MAMAAPQQAATTAFWQWLAPRADRLPELEDGASPFWDEVLGHLKAIDDGLWLEIGGGMDPRELVLTASGNPGLFDLVDAICTQAPALAGWCVVALKPALGFDCKLRYEGVEIDPKASWFKSVGLRDAPDLLGLCVAVPGYSIESDESWCSGVMVLLDSALGEREAALEIRLVDVVAAPADPDGAGYLPLVDLANFIEWRRKRRASQAH